MPDRNRLIFHIDVNSAFLSWTALERLAQGDSVDLRTIPAIVGGDTSTRHGVVLAKSIPAKAFGITTGEPVVNALRKCPHLVMASPDHSMYREKSRLLMEHLSGICPDIEQVSIDECYMDYSPIAAQYSSPEAAAAYIRDSVREKISFYCKCWGFRTERSWPRWLRIFKNRIRHIPYIRKRSRKRCGRFPSLPCSPADTPVRKLFGNWGSSP